MSEWSGSAATDRLHDTIYNEKTSEQTERMIRLTRQVLILTWLLLVGLLVQIALAVFD